MLSIGLSGANYSIVLEFFVLFLSIFDLFCRGQLFKKDHTREEIIGFSKKNSSMVYFFFSLKYVVTEAISKKSICEKNNKRFPRNRFGCSVPPVFIVLWAVILCEVISYKAICEKKYRIIPRNLFTSAFTSQGCRQKRNSLQIVVGKFTNCEPESYMLSEWQTFFHQISSTPIARK